jgi:hypothetical protein
MLFFLCSQTFAFEKEVRLKEDETLRVIYDSDGNYVVVEILPNRQVVVRSSDIETKYEIPDVNKERQYSFDDIKDHWAREEIQKMIDMGLLKGYPDGTFRPNNSISRAEYGTILARIIELEKQKKLTVGDNQFTDVISNSWYYNYIAKLQHNDNIDPKIYDNVLQPNSPITRQEMALWLASEIKNGGEQLAFIDEAGIDYKVEVNKAVSQGLLKGYPDKTFRPDGQTTRAEAATIFIRYMQLKSLVQ